MSALLNLDKKPTTQIVDILVTLAEDFSLNSTATDNAAYYGFTAAELALLKKKYSRINLLSKEGEILQTRELNDNEDLPIAQLIDPFPISAKCLQFIREINQTHYDIDIMVRAVSEIAESHNTFASTRSSTLPFWGSHGNPSQSLSGFSELLGNEGPDNNEEEGETFLDCVRKLPGLNVKELGVANTLSPIVTPIGSPINGYGEEQEETSNEENWRRKRLKL